MNYQPYLRPGFRVDPIPAPREKVRLLMLATSVVVEGLVDPEPGRIDPRLANCLYMNQAGVIIAGTACRRPLMLREAVDISTAAELDVLVVRNDERDAYATFDLKLTSVDGMLCGYRMWMPTPTGSAWLIPTAGDEQHVRITPLGLEVYTKPPFTSSFERQAGLAHGKEFLSVAVQGWF